MNKTLAVAAGMAFSGMMISQNDVMAQNAAGKTGPATNQNISAQNISTRTAALRALSPQQLRQIQDPAASNGDRNKLAVTVNGLSYHFTKRSFNDDGVQRPFNEFNPGLGLEYRLSDKFHISVGSYKNSLYKRSTYGGIGWEGRNDRTIGFGSEFGAVTGYPSSPVLPVVNPYVRIGNRNDRFNLKLGVIPSPNTPVFTFQGRINLNW